LSRGFAYFNLGALLLHCDFPEKTKFEYEISDHQQGREHEAGVH
jgi:hypothetical protein